MRQSSRLLASSPVWQDARFGAQRAVLGAGAAAAAAAQEDVDRDDGHDQDQSDQTTARGRTDAATGRPTAGQAKATRQAKATATAAALATGVANLSRIESSPTSESHMRLRVPTFRSRPCRAQCEAHCSRLTF